MLTIEVAGTRVAQDLEAAEEAINEALRRIARLQGSMMNLRIDTDLPQYEGQTSVVRVNKANTCLIDGMTHLAQAHKGLKTNYERISAGFEDGDRCPLPKKTALADTEAA